MIAQREYTRRGINMRNEMRMEFDAVSNNEGFARVAVAAFIAPLNPTLEEVSDIKTAVSEAVTNSIIHGYENIYGYGRHGAEKPEGMVIHPGKVTLSCLMENGVLYITVEDRGKGMENVEQAMEPLFTSRPELERSGMALPSWRPSWTIWRWKAHRGGNHSKDAGKSWGQAPGLIMRNKIWKKHQCSLQNHRQEIKVQGRY